MPGRKVGEYTILDGATPVTIVSSTDATPIVVTATAHGFSDGDLVLIFGHTTNVAANGIFKVANKTANTFELTDRDTGADIAGSGGGAGGATGLVVAAPAVALVEDFRHAVLHVITAGTATTTIKVAGSLGKLPADSDKHGDTPLFGGTQSATNPYSYLNIINLEDGVNVEGDTGIVVAGTDFHRTYEVNTNGLKYLTAYPISWTQGNITMKLSLYAD